MRKLILTGLSYLGIRRNEMLDKDGRPTVLEYFIIVGHFEDYLMQNLIIDAIQLGKVKLSDDYFELFDKGVTAWKRQSENIINFSTGLKKVKSG